MSPTDARVAAAQRRELARARAAVASQAMTDIALVRRRPWVTARPTGALAVDVEFEQYGRQWHLVSDEALERGGSELGPSPMRYLLAGMSACLIGWVVKIADEQSERVEITDLTIRTMLDMRGENAIADVPAHPEWFVVDVTLADDSAANSLSIVRSAIKRCPLTSLVSTAAPTHVLVRQGARIIADDRPEQIRAADDEELTR